jgi:hypothetical protein
LFSKEYNLILDDFASTAGRDVSRRDAEEYIRETKAVYLSPLYLLFFNFINFFKIK